jgi:hypothetical protein
MLSRQALHKEADRARFFAHLVGDEETADRLRQYATELDAMAEAVTGEAAWSPQHPCGDEPDA